MNLLARFVKKLCILIGNINVMSQNFIKNHLGSSPDDKLHVRKKPQDDSLFVIGTQPLASAYFEC